MERETRETVFLAALRETLAWFEETLGGEMEEWTWGQLHTATFVSNPLGQSGIGLLGNLVNLGPLPVDGGSSVVKANSWSFDDPGGVTDHVSMRMMIDLADVTRSRAILPTGQSGHPLHAHYEDMFPTWRDGLYYPMLWDQEQIESASVERLLLRPG